MDGRTWEEKWDDGYFSKDGGQPSLDEREDIWEDHPEDIWEDHPEDEEDFLVGETMAPDLALISKSLTPYEGTKPRNLVANQWVCPHCLKLYRGSINYISDIQEYECSQCKLKNPCAYDWTLIRCKLNQVPLNFSRVYDQFATHNCVLCAFLALYDMMRRVRGARFGYDEGSPFDANGMNWNYKRVAGCSVGEISERVYEMMKELKPQRHPTIELMLMAACYYGVPYISNTYYDLEQCVRYGINEFRVLQRTLNVTSWFRVPGDDVNRITRLLGHGIPLLAIVPTGKLLDYLDEEDVYYAPAPEGCSKHAIVLHGSGTAMPQGSLFELADSSETSICEVFYRCRNSHGTKAHPSIEHKRKKGADFKIWARHIVGDVYGINLADFDI